MSVVVSFCIFGKDEKDIYYGGAVKNALLYGHYHPDWYLYFYIGESVPISVQEEIWEANPLVIIKPMSLPENQSATGWRFLTLREKNWDYFLFRDVDSRPIDRERAAVAEWMDSNSAFHAMRDHPYHNVPMLAGLWGCTQKGAAKVRQYVPDVLEHDYYQVDQQFLKRAVWRPARRYMMVHTPVPMPWDRHSVRRPYTVPRTDGTFVGEGFYADDTPRIPEHRPMVEGS